jgi:enoyl-CoA hydratase
MLYTLRAPAAVTSTRAGGTSQHGGHPDRTGPDQRIRYEVDGPIATITNDNPAKRNAFDDAMDQRLFEVVGEIARNSDIRAVIWRAEGTSFSSGRDVSAIGGGAVPLTHHEVMTRGHRGIQQILDLEVPVIVAMQGWPRRRTG